MAWRSHAVTGPEVTVVEEDTRWRQRGDGAESAVPPVGTAVVLGEVRAMLGQVRAGLSDLHGELRAIRSALAERRDCGSWSCAGAGQPPDAPALWALARRAHRAAGMAVPFSDDEDEDEPVSPAAALAASRVLAGREQREREHPG